MGSYFIRTRMTAFQADGYGAIAGEADGIVTIDNVPGRAEVRLFRRSDSAWISRQFSRGDGTYRFKGVGLHVEHDLIARDMFGVWGDVIVGRVLPFIPLSISGDAPGCAVGVPYSYSYIIEGGEAPYEISIAGALPSGLVLVSDGVVATISGTPLEDAVGTAWEITVQDSRGATASINDSMGVTTTRFWRLYFNEETDVISGYGRYVQLCELEFNGARATGGAAFASDSIDDPPQFALSNAFDGVKAGDNSVWGAMYMSGLTLGYEFATAIDVSSVSITSRQNSAVAAAWSPRGFVVQCSSDGIEWIDVWSVSGQTGWAGNETRTFNRP